MREYINLIESFELGEATIITDLETMNEPLSDDDTIRLYHGVDDPMVVHTAITRGLTGETKADRNFSYEANNNPYGLFVTPDFKTAKRFGAYIIELNIKVSDLETPVWPSGTFAGQGQYAPSFDNEEERNDALEKARTTSSSHENDIISKSDSPEVAAMLLQGGERQALFTGKLNPNSIKTIWKRTDVGNVSSPYERLTRKEFLKIFKQGEVADPFSGKIYSDDDIKKHNKLFLPRDKATLESFIELLLKKHKHLTSDKIVTLLRKNHKIIKDHVWTKSQEQDIINDLEALDK